MRITVLGGTGYGGSAVVREAVRRGHEVTSFSRHAPADPIEGAAYRVGSATDSAPLAEAVAGADAVFVAVSPRGDMAGRVEGVVDALARMAVEPGVRVGFLGGVSSVLVRPDGPTVFDEYPPPAEILDEVKTGMNVLDYFRSTTDLDWFYVSPALEFGSWIDAPVTGTYRVSEDVLILDAAGRSVIAAEDLALAVLDEIDNPRHSRSRFHVAL